MREHVADADARLKRAFYPTSRLEFPASLGDVAVFSPLRGEEYADDVKRLYGIELPDHRDQ